jgi:uncharacterized membrane protein YfcA
MVLNIAGEHKGSPHVKERHVPVLFIVVGVVAGILSGLFGIGGGVVIVPALILLAGMVPIAATGTSLGALLLPVGALGAWEYYRRGDLNIAASLWIAIGLIGGVYLGARLAHFISPLALRRSFAVFLALVSVKMWVG